MLMHKYLISMLMMMLLVGIVFLLKKVCKKIKKAIGGRTLDGILYGKYDDIVSIKDYDLKVRNRRKY